MSVYRVIDVVGTSTTSWEEAAADAINTARQSVRDLRVAEVIKQDIHVGDGGEDHPPASAASRPTRFNAGVAQTAIAITLAWHRPDPTRHGWRRVIRCTARRRLLPAVPHT